MGASPRLLIPSCRTRPPLPVCLGTRPIQAANSRASLNAVGDPILSHDRRGRQRCVNAVRSFLNYFRSGAARAGGVTRAFGR